MSESKHTPGPWEVGFIDRSPRDIVAKACGYVALAKVYLTDPKTRKRTPEYEANLRLIVAAPELLEALEGILADVSSYGLAHPEGGRFECDYLDAARAAIAKAKGLPK